MALREVWTRLDFGKQADEMMIFRYAQADAKSVEARYNELKKQAS